jgi:hypothetical protein
LSSKSIFQSIDLPDTVSLHKYHLFRKLVSTQRRYPNEVCDNNSL